MFSIVGLFYLRVVKTQDRILQGCEMTVYKHFLLFQPYFSTAFYLSVFRIWDCMTKRSERTSTKIPENFNHVIYMYMYLKRPSYAPIKFKCIGQFIWLYDSKRQQFTNEEDC